MASRLKKPRPRAKSFSCPIGADERSQHERLFVLEQRVGHIETTATVMGGKVDEMHDLLLKGKGARWAIIALAGVGGFIAYAASHILPLIWMRGG
jgi:hypothetical protein